MKNRFAKTTDQLPDSAEEFFNTHWSTKVEGIVTTQDLRDRLHELRLAWGKYEDHRPRIKEMADVLKIGVNGFTEKEKKMSQFKKEAIKSLT